MQAAAFDRGFLLALYPKARHIHQLKFIEEQPNNKKTTLAVVFLVFNMTFELVLDLFVDITGPSFLRAELATALCSSSAPALASSEHPQP